MEEISADLINLGFSEEEAEIEVLTEDGIKVSRRLIVELKKTINLMGLAGIARKYKLKVGKGTIKATKPTIHFFLNKTLQRLETVREMRALESCWKDLMKRASALNLLKKAEQKFKIIAIKKDSIVIFFHSNFIKLLRELFQLNVTNDMDVDVKFGKNNHVIFSLPAEKTQSALPLIHCALRLFARGVMQKIIERDYTESRAKAERVVVTKETIEKSARNLFAPFGSAVKKISVYYKKGLYYVPIIINSFKIKANFPSLNDAVNEVRKMEDCLTDFGARFNINIRQKGEIYELSLRISSFRVPVSASDIPKMEAELTKTANKLGDLFALKDA